MTEQALQGPTTHTEWNIGDDFDPSALNAIFGQPAVEADAWVYDDAESNHGHHWDINEGGISIDFFHKTGLLFISGSDLSHQSVLQGEAESSHENTVAYSVNNILTEVNDDHKVATFTTRETNNGQRLIIGQTGEITVLPPVNKAPTPITPLSETGIFQASSEAQNITIQSDYEDGGHN